LRGCHGECVVVNRVLLVHTGHGVNARLCARTSHAGDNTGVARHLRAFVLLGASLDANNSLALHQMEHIFPCLFHASQECHSSRHLPCSASTPIVALLSCSRRRWSVAHSPKQRSKSASCVWLQFVRDRRVNTLLFSANVALFSTSNSADGKQTAERFASASVCN